MTNVFLVCLFSSLEPNGPVFVKGLYYDIWQILERRLNFSTKITKLKDGKSKGWSVLIGTVAGTVYILGQ